MLLLLLFLAISSNALEQPNGQQSELNQFEQSRQQILNANGKDIPSNEAAPLNAQELPGGKNSKKEIDKNAQIGTPGQKNAIDKGKLPGIKQKQIDPPRFNPNLVPNEGGNAKNKLKEGKKKNGGRRKQKKRINKVNGILPFDSDLVPMEGQKSARRDNENNVEVEERKKVKKTKKQTKKGGGNKKRRNKEIEKQN